jgi:tetratricopeptide (TPR) repeat protein
MERIAARALRYCDMPSVAQLEKLLAADLHDAFVLYALAQEHAKAATAEGHAKALEFYDRCLAVDGSYHYAYFHKAKSQQAMGDVQAATGTLRAGLLAARRANDTKAASEIAGFLDELEP